MSATREVILMAAAILTKSVLAMPHPPSTCRTLSASASASRSTSGTPSPEPCVFPFSFDGTEHHACTDDVNNYLLTTSVLTNRHYSLTRWATTGARWRRTLPGGTSWGALAIATSTLAASTRTKEKISKKVLSADAPPSPPEGALGGRRSAFSRSSTSEEI